MSNKWVIGNWKKNGSLAFVKAWAENFLRVQPSSLGGVIGIICPPVPYISALSQILRDTPFQLGAQDCDFADTSAHTGGVSAAMLKDLECTSVLVGHSERRNLDRECDAYILRKIKNAWCSGLRVVLCVGEEAQEQGAISTYQVIADQLRGALPQGWQERAEAGSLVVAYEPIWAIGTGVSFCPKRILPVLNWIKENIKTPVLYGGSVTPNNVQDILELPAVDGVLVGGASLNPEDFLAILEAAKLRMALS